jgi:hypothetical protein
MRSRRRLRRRARRRRRRRCANAAAARLGVLRKVASVVIRPTEAAMMRSAVFLAACVVASTIAFAEFHPAEAQQQYQAPEGEALQRLIRRALGLPESSTITEIAEVTPREPIANAGTGREAWLSASRPTQWSPMMFYSDFSDTGMIAVARPREEDISPPTVSLIFRSSPQTRFLVICEFRRDGAFDIVVDRSGTPLHFTWETPERGALLITPAPSVQQHISLVFSVPPTAPEDSQLRLSRCEISAISA